MLYVILALYVVQAFITVYALYDLRCLHRRVKDLEEHLFDV